MSSGTARLGWVSLSWIAAFSGSVRQSEFDSRNRRTSIRERTGDEEIFLHEPELASLGRMVVRIENAGQRFGVERFRDRSDEVAAAEPLEIERMRRGRAPQAQRVDRLAAVADHGPIIGHADERRGAVGDHAQLPGAQFERAAERHRDAFGRAHDLPGIGMIEPVVRALLLPAVADLLLEDAMLVAQPVTHRGQLHRGHRVEEAGRQTPEAAVAQPGVGLLVKDLPPFAAVARRSSARRSDRA